MNGYGAPTMYGVPVAEWNSWSAFTQQKYLEDYNRTDAQATYYTMDTKSDAWKAAYTYTGIVDAVTGLEAVETGEDVNQMVEDLQEKAGDVLDTGKDVVIIAAIVGVLLLMRK